MAVARHTDCTVAFLDDVIEHGVHSVRKLFVDCVHTINRGVDVVQNIRIVRDLVILVLDKL